MAKLAILALVLSALASGCIHAPGADPAPNSAVPVDAAPASPAPAPATSDIPPCPIISNYGISVQLGDLYLKSPIGGNLAVVYQESNGCQGLQTEEERPADPDTKVAEVPYPVAMEMLAAGAAASANA